MFFVFFPFFNINFTIVVNVLYFLFIIHLVFFFYEKEEHFKNALKHFLLKSIYIFKKCLHCYGALMVPGNPSQYCCKTDLAKKCFDH